VLFIGWLLNWLSKIRGMNNIITSCLNSGLTAEKKKTNLRDRRLPPRLKWILGHRDSWRWDRWVVPKHRFQTTSRHIILGLSDHFSRSLLAQGKRNIQDWNLVCNPNGIRTTTWVYEKSKRYPSCSRDLCRRWSYVLFDLGLFEDAVGGSGGTVWKVWTISVSWKGCGQAWLWPDLTHYSDIWLQGLRKTAKSGSRCSQSRGRESYQWTANCDVWCNRQKPV
jgi:hypothetical protein